MPPTDPFKCHHFCAVLTKFKSNKCPDAPEWRAVDHDANCIKHIVKGTLTSKYSRKRHISKAGRSWNLDPTRADTFYAPFGHWSTHVLGCLFAAGQKVALVPIPSKKTVGRSDPNERTALLARAIESAAVRSAAEPVFTMVPSLYWAESVLESHKGGTRSAIELHRHLAVESWMLGGFDSVVLVDDAHTTGNHLLAAARRVLDDAEVPVGAAVCAVRFLEKPTPDPFAVEPELLDTGALDLRLALEDEDF